MTKAQIHRLELLEKIAVLQDPKKLIKLKRFFEDEIADTNQPSNEELFALAEASQARMEKGLYKTWDHVKEQIKITKEKGLLARQISGK
jgi:predicted metal-dependent HD superfamily phosphohydrolase